MVESFVHSILWTNKLKVSKRNRYYKTLGTSLLNGPLSLLSLGLFSHFINIYTLILTVQIYFMVKFLYSQVMFLCNYKSLSVCKQIHRSFNCSLRFFLIFSPSFNKSSEQIMYRIVLLKIFHNFLDIMKINTSLVY